MAISMETEYNQTLPSNIDIWRSSIQFTENINENMAICMMSVWHPDSTILILMYFFLLFKLGNHNYSMEIICEAWYNDFEPVF